MGTAPYMSPEQARGKTVDKRSDIWAFGCVLFEALAGREAFLGDTVSDTIARILEHDPDWNALPSKTPSYLRKLLKHCLEKDARRRLRDMGDALYELEQKEPELVPPRSSYPWRVAVGWSIPAVILGGILWATRGGGPDTAASQSVVRFLTEDIVLGVDWDTGMAMAPNGSSLAYTHEVDGVPRLFLRRLDRAEAESIPGTEDARNPFFSPDGEQIGFFDVRNGQLKKVALRGGAPVAIGENGSGASWGPDGAIVVSEFNASLGQLPASGAPRKRVTHIEPNTNERTHRWPFVLPGGESVLFTVSHKRSASWDEAHIAVGSIETGEHRILIDGGTSPHYVATGHIVYARAGSLHSVPFDLDRLEVTGPSVTVVDGVVMNRLTGSSHFSVSLDGTLAYRRGTIRARTAEMLWVDREGRASPLAAPALSLIRLDLSPDGGFVALNIDSAAVDVWVHEIARNITTRLTFENLNLQGVWSPDGSRLAFGTVVATENHLVQVPVDGSIEPERLMTSTDSQLRPFSWSPDGRALVFTASEDIWILPLEGDRTAQQFLETPFQEDNPHFSPDGRWIAYSSDESGRREIYVRPFPDPDRKWQMSTDGGELPIWGPDGTELFYRNGNRMMVVEIATDPDFQPKRARLLFEEESFRSSYDIHPDGQRFLMTRNIEPPPSPIEVIVNWGEELKRLVPTDK